MTHPRETVVNALRLNALDRLAPKAAPAPAAEEPGPVVNGGWADVGTPPMETTAVVSVARGSWRWQDAYRVVAYRPYRTNDGRLLWGSHHHVTGKMSGPQLRRAGHGGHTGSLHNRPLTADELEMHRQLSDPMSLAADRKSREAAEAPAGTDAELHRDAALAHAVARDKAEEDDRTHAAARHAAAIRYHSHMAAAWDPAGGGATVNAAAARPNPPNPRHLLDRHGMDPPPTDAQKAAYDTARGLMKSAPHGMLTAADVIHARWSGFGDAFLKRARGLKAWADAEGHHAELTESPDLKLRAHAVELEMHRKGPDERLAEAGGRLAGGPDWRPNHAIPEDFYANSGGPAGAEVWGSPAHVARLLAAPDRAAEASFSIPEGDYPRAAHWASTARVVHGDYAAAASHHEAAAGLHQARATGGRLGTERAATKEQRATHAAAAGAHREAAEAMRVADPTPHRHDEVSRAAHELGRAANVDGEGEPVGVRDDNADRPEAYRAQAALHGAAADAHGVAVDKAMDDGDRDRELHHRYWREHHERREAGRTAMADQWDWVLGRVPADTPGGGESVWRAAGELPTGNEDHGDNVERLVGAARDADVHAGGLKAHLGYGLGKHTGPQSLKHDYELGGPLDAINHFNAGRYGEAAAAYRRAAEHYDHTADRQAARTTPDQTGYHTMLNDDMVTDLRGAVDRFRLAARAAEVADPAPHAGHPSSGAAHAATAEARQETTAADREIRPDFRRSLELHGAAAGLHEAAAGEAARTGGSARELHHRYWAKYHRRETEALTGNAKNWGWDSKHPEYSRGEGPYEWNEFGRDEPDEHSRLLDATHLAGRASTRANNGAESAISPILDHLAEKASDVAGWRPQEAMNYHRSAGEYHESNANYERRVGGPGSKRRSQLHREAAAAHLHAEKVAEATSPQTRDALLARGHPGTREAHEASAATRPEESTTDLERYFLHLKAAGAHRAAAEAPDQGPGRRSRYSFYADPKLHHEYHEAAHLRDAARHRPAVESTMDSEPGKVLAAASKVGYTEPEPAPHASRPMSAAAVALGHRAAAPGETFKAGRHGAAATAHAVAVDEAAEAGDFPRLLYHRQRQAHHEALAGPTGNRRRLTTNTLGPRQQPLPAAYAGMRNAIVRGDPVTEGDVEHRLRVRRGVDADRARGEWNDLHRHLGLPTADAMSGAPFGVHAALHRRYGDPMARAAENASDRGKPSLVQSYNDPDAFSGQRYRGLHGEAAIAHLVAADKAAEEGRTHDEAYHRGEAAYHRAKEAGGRELEADWGGVGRHTWQQPSEHQRQAYREMTAITGRRPGSVHSRGGNPSEVGDPRQGLRFRTYAVPQDKADAMKEWAEPAGHQVDGVRGSRGDWHHVDVMVHHLHSSQEEPTDNRRAPVRNAEPEYPAATAHLDALRATNRLVDGGQRPTAAVNARLAWTRGDFRAAATHHDASAGFHNTVGIHQSHNNMPSAGHHVEAAALHKKAAAAARLLDPRPFASDPMSAAAHAASAEARDADAHAQVGAAPGAYRHAAGKHGEAATAHRVAKDKAQDEYDAPDSEARAAHHEFSARYHEERRDTLLRTAALRESGGTTT